MPRNLSFSEYEKLLDSETAGLFGVSYSRVRTTLSITPFSSSPALQEPSRSFEVVIRLRPHVGAYAVPQISVEGSTPLTRDPFDVLIQIEEARHTVIQASGLFGRIREKRVWAGNQIPCDLCGGVGKMPGRGGQMEDCGLCHGAAYREVSP